MDSPSSLPNKNAAAKPPAPGASDQTNAHSLGVLARESPAITAPGMLVEGEEKDITKGPKTPGEKFYDSLQFSMGKVLIMVATAALGYVAKYGKNSYGPVPNVLKKFQGWTHNTLLHNKVMPLAEKGEFGQRLAGAFSNTTTLFWGGTAFAPIMKYMENNHEKIANTVNERHGTPEDIAITHERLKDDPQQTWGDVAKGRIAAWSLVFTSFMTADHLLGKNKDGLHWFDWYEEKFARWAAGFTKAGKDIAKVPVSKVLTEAQDANKFYRFAKISALDVYATTAGILIWTFVSRMSAKKRQEKNAEKAEAPAAAAPEMAVSAPEMAENTVSGVETPEKRFTDSIAPALKETAPKIRPEKFADALNTQKSAISAPSLLLGA